VSYADFDRYVEENDIAVEDLGEAFAQWLSNQTGEAVIGGPVGEPPAVVAIPDEEGDDE
jgi:hypothetical protein